MPYHFWAFLEARSSRKVLKFYRICLRIGSKNRFRDFNYTLYTPAVPEEFLFSLFSHIAETEAFKRGLLDIVRANPAHFDHNVLFSILQKHSLVYQLKEQSLLVSSRPIIVNYIEVV